MFSQRSYKKELLDRNDIPFEDIKQNMKELNFINTWLGGHNITLDGFKKLAGNKTQLSVCEIGCGGGDNLLAIDKFCTKKNISASLTGIDLKPECIAFAKERNEFHNPVKWITSDYKDAAFDTLPDIIFSSLFCHHFTDEELCFQFKWMRENCTTGFFINDLQRHVAAYYSIKFLTRLFSSSYLVKNDAPLSVLRSFSKKEMESILGAAGIKDYNLEWKWAFRYLVIARKPTVLLLENVGMM